MDGVAFAVPGPGSWELETTHYQRPVSRFSVDLLMSAFVEGFADGASRYGLMVDHLEPAIDMLVRVVLSHVMQPSAAPERTAADVAWIARRVLER